MSSNTAKSLKLFLASSSPRRLELIRQLGLDCEMVNAPIEEVGLPGEPVASYVLRMAVEKAMSGYNKLPGDDIWVVGGDTLIYFEGKVLGKPRNKAEGCQMLRKLSNTTHQVFSSVAVMHDGAVFSDVNQTQVSFRALTDTEIEAYWQTGEPVDKAGAYAIQGMGARFVKKIEGSYSAVMGLPLYELDKLLKDAGFDAREV